MKKYIIIVIFILALSFSPAIKISPTQQELVMKQYETNCTNIWILPETNYTISSKWSNDGKGDLTKYTLTSERIKLEVNYSYLSEGKYEFCFTPNRAGNFSGIIYFYDQKSMIEIGSWFDLKVQYVGTIEQISLITGNVIGKTNKVNVGLGIVFFLLLIIFSLIIKRTFIDKHS